MFVLRGWRGEIEQHLNVAFTFFIEKEFKEVEIFKLRVWSESENRIFIYIK